ncbi:hypothetical protein [Streptomyces sp. NRRL S-350]|uniref:hypothetical protein n=1 Tax=Streptomyces sp. NRRL S-350 TaxID=1463902 RepID=UPI001F47EEB6|nr:hypothetical protein [Streptomyces sp. NRRL S-350]
MYFSGSTEVSPDHGPGSNGACAAATPATPGGILPGPHVAVPEWQFQAEMNPTHRGDFTVTGWTGDFFRCTTCDGMFSIGAGAVNGVCPGRLPHREQTAVGSLLVLGHHETGDTGYFFATSWSVRDAFASGWALCGHCGLMFFHGDPSDQGVCPEPGADTHHAVSVDFGAESAFDDF